MLRVVVALGDLLCHALARTKLYSTPDHPLSLRPTPSLAIRCMFCFVFGLLHVSFGFTRLLGLDRYTVPDWNMDYTVPDWDWSGLSFPSDVGRQRRCEGRGGPPRLRRHLLDADHDQTDRARGRHDTPGEKAGKGW